MVGVQGCAGAPGCTLPTPSWEGDSREALGASLAEGSSPPRGTS